MPTIREQSDAHVKEKYGILFSFSVIKKTSSRLVAARGGKKGRIRLFDGDAVLAPEKELGAAVDINRHLRDRQAPCLFIPTVDGTIPIGFQIAF